MMAESSFELFVGSAGSTRHTHHPRMPGSQFLNAHGLFTSDGDLVTIDWLVPGAQCHDPEFFLLALASQPTKLITTEQDRRCRAGDLRFGVGFTLQLRNPEPNLDSRHLPLDATGSPPDRRTHGSRLLLHLTSHNHPRTLQRQRESSASRSSEKQMNRKRSWILGPASR